MAALIRCSACQAGQCQHCTPRGGSDGLIGGWSCVCAHTDKEREQARQAWRGGLVAPRPRCSCGCHTGTVKHAGPCSCQRPSRRPAPTRT
jgi:hypothetical protein